MIGWNSGTPSVIDLSLCVSVCCSQEVPSSVVEKEFWRLVSSIEDDVSTHAHSSALFCCT